MTDEDIRRSMLETYFGGGVSPIQSVELEADRTNISNFLDFSERYQGVPFRTLSAFGGLEFVFSYEKPFEAIGVSGQTLAACMDGDDDSIRNVSRAILSSLERGRKLSEDGEAHIASRGLVINPTAAKAFVLAALDARERYQLDEIIPELYYLLSVLFFPGTPDAEKIRQNNDLKHTVVFLSWAFRYKHGRHPSYRKIAKILGVAPSTVSRLFESSDDFKRQIGSWARLWGSGKGDPSKHPALVDIYPDL